MSLTQANKSSGQGNKSLSRTKKSLKESLKSLGKMLFLTPVRIALGNIISYGDSLKLYTLQTQPISSNEEWRNMQMFFIAN
jgi:hypothetical protein